MNDISLATLENRLRRTVWGPVSIVALIVILTSMTLQFEGRQRDWHHLEAELSQTLELQKRAFSEELFLSEQEAIELRVKEILHHWEQISPETPACVRLVVSAPFGALKGFGGCSGPQPDAAWPASYQKLEIMVGSKEMAQVRYAILRRPSWKDILPPQLILGLLISALLAAFLTRYLIARLRATILLPLLERIARDQRNALVAQATQMLAHDVRKPIYLMKLALGALKNTRTKEEFESRHPRFLSEVESALIATDGMLSDVIGLGENSNGARVETSIRRAIEKSLTDIFRIFPESAIHLRYELRHHNKILVDDRRVPRVFFNIVENAIQAMGGKGELWFKTESVSRAGAPFVKITIGNSGPFIPEAIRQNIFSPFFTSKQDGTGLGLALAMKVVEEHGGELSCSSEPTGTEFSFTLPQGNQPDEFHFELPVFDGGGPATVPPTSQPVSQSLRESAPPRIPVLVFDDDWLVHQVWDIALQSASNLILHHYRSWEEFESRAKAGETLDARAIAFVDLHFSGSRYDGVAIARKLRQLGVGRLYATTADKPIFASREVFDAVYDKDVIHRPEIKALLSID